MSGPETENRILVIEDDRGIAQGLRALLSSRGYDVDLAAGAKTALEQAAEHRYGLVLADFDLGDQNSLDVIRRLRALDPGLRVLGVTALDRVTAESRAGDLALDGFFEKPVDPEELMAAVRRHVGHA